MKHYSIFPRLVVSLSAAACFGPAACLAAPRYKVTATLLLPPSYQISPGTGLYVTALNNQGSAVGYVSEHPASARWPSTYTALLWRHGKASMLTALPGYTNSIAEGLNNSGEVVGFLSTYEGPGERAFVWQAGKMRLLPLLPGSYDSAANGINNRGQIVGSSGDHACLWSGGQVYDLGAGEAKRINNRGQIAGDERIPAAGLEGKMGGFVSRALLWEQGHRIILGAGIPGGVNDRGQVVVNDTWGAYLWQKGQICNLGGLVAKTERQCWATGVDNRGQIVGVTDSTAPGSVHPFLWQQGKMYDLGLLVTPATKYFLDSTNGAISERGQIVWPGGKGLVLLIPRN